MVILPSATVSWHMHGQLNCKGWSDWPVGWEGRGKDGERHMGF